MEYHIKNHNETNGVVSFENGWEFSYIIKNNKYFLGYYDLDYDEEYVPGFDNLLQLIDFFIKCDFVDKDTLESLLDWKDEVDCGKTIPLFASDGDGNNWVNGLLQQNSELN